MHTHPCDGRGPSIIALFLAGAVASCESGADASVTVVVPVSVQQRFSATSRGELIVDVAIPGVGAMRGYRGLCAPTASDLSVSIMVSEFGCVDSVNATVTAWVAPAPATRTVLCGSQAVPGSTFSIPTPTSVAGLVGFGSQSATVSPMFGLCRSGSLTATVTVAPGGA